MTRDFSYRLRNANIYSWYPPTMCRQISIILSNLSSRTYQPLKENMCEIQTYCKYSKQVCIFLLRPLLLFAFFEKIIYNDYVWKKFGGQTYAFS